GRPVSTIVLVQSQGRTSTSYLTDRLQSILAAIRAVPSCKRQALETGPRWARRGDGNQRRQRPGALPRIGRTSASHRGRLLLVSPSQGEAEPFGRPREDRDRDKTRGSVSSRCMDARAER